MQPDSSALVEHYTAMHRGLRRVVVDAESAKADASFAVSLLSDSWVSDAASIVVCSNSPMVLVRDIPSDERKRYSSVAEAEIARLDSISKVAKDAAFDIQVEVFKLMGDNYYMLWIATVNDIPTHRTENYQQWLPPM
jgi:hypothetical protein